MALFTENMNPIAQDVSVSWMPETPDMQADVREICEKWGISSLDFNDQRFSSPSSTEEDFLALSELVSGWSNAGGEVNHFSAIHPHPEMTYPPKLAAWMSPVTPDPAGLPFPIQFSPGVYADHCPSGHVEGLDSSPLEDHDFSTESQASPSSSGTSSSNSPYGLIRIEPYSEEPLPGDRIAPSRRRSSPDDGHVVLRNRPYPPPSGCMFSQRHFVGVDSSYVPISSPERGVRAGTSVESGIPPTASPIGASGPAQHAQHSSHITPQREPILLVETSRVRRGRISVPLGEWRPKRLAKKWEPQAAIEFWSRETATGNKLPGTFLADRFQEDTGRELLLEKDHPFLDKKERGFNLRVLWPGYSEFSKKISVHKALSACTLRDVRDWVFSALSDFIRTPGAQVRDMDFWRVGSDGDTIHLGDLVLVRLKQVGKGTWVPELELLDWERTI